MVNDISEYVERAQIEIFNMHARNNSGIRLWLSNAKIPKDIRKSAKTHTDRIFDLLVGINNHTVEYHEGMGGIRSERDSLKKLLHDYIGPTSREVAELKNNLSRFYQRHGVGTKVADEWSGLIPSDAVVYSQSPPYELSLRYLENAFALLTKGEEIEPNAAAILLAHPDVRTMFSQPFPPITSENDVESIIQEYRRVIGYETPDTVLAAAKIVIPHLKRKDRS